MKNILSLFYDFLDSEGVITCEEKKNDLIDRYIESTDKEIKPEDISAVVLSKYKIDFEQVCQPTRKREIVEARQLIMYFLDQYTKLSYAKIGALFYAKGHVFDHATVSHAKKTVNNLIETDRSYRETFLELRTLIEK